MDVSLLLNGNLLLKIFGVVLLSSFLPLSAYSFYKFYRPKKGNDYNELLAALDLQSSPANALLAMEDRSGFKEYIFPVAFATLLCVLWSVALLFGADMKLVEQPHFLLSGNQTLFATEGGKLDKPTILYQKVSLLVMLLSMLGAYIWSLRNILTRMTTIDLPPSTYFSVAIRMLLATFVALMIRFIWPDPELVKNINLSEVNTASYDALLVVAFLTGMFPDRAIQYLKEKIPIFSDSKHTVKSDDLPLSMIEGINMFHKVRLAEIGIDNAQNLAEANLVEVLIRTPFKPKRVIDWIAQARLYIYFKSDIEELRKLGIRTIFDFKMAADNAKKIKNLVKNSKLSEVYLTNVYAQIEDDPILKKLGTASVDLNVI